MTLFCLPAWSKAGEMEALPNPVCAPPPGGSSSVHTLLSMTPTAGTTLRGGCNLRGSSTHGSRIKPHRGCSSRLPPEDARHVFGRERWCHRLPRCLAASSWGHECDPVECQCRDGVVWKSQISLDNFLLEPGLKVASVLDLQQEN